MVTIENFSEATLLNYSIILDKTLSESTKNYLRLVTFVNSDCNTLNLPFYVFCIPDTETFSRKLGVLTC